MVDELLRYLTRAAYEYAFYLFRLNGEAVDYPEVLQKGDSYRIVSYLGKRYRISCELLGDLTPGESLSKEDRP
jgi:hypothetical protein